MIAVRQCKKCNMEFDAEVGKDKNLYCELCREEKKYVPKKKVEYDDFFSYGISSPKKLPQKTGTSMDEIMDMLFQNISPKR